MVLRFDEVVRVQPDQPVRFSGACTIGQIKGQHRLLAEAFKHDRIDVDLAGVESVDVTFVQLLVAAFRTAAGRGLAMRLTAVPAHVAASFQRAGFTIAPDTGRILGI